MTHIDPARKSRLMEIFAVEGLPLFVPLATPDDELTPASTVELLEEGIYEDVRSSSKVTLATSRASWIDAESRRPVVGKVTISYVPSRLRLLRSAFNLALLTFRNRSCTVQALAAVLFGALATLLIPDELKVVVVAEVDGIKDTGDVSKRFVEGGAHVFDAEEELTRVVLSIDVPRHIGELQRRGTPAPHMIISALDTLKRILEDRSWRHASDQREALAYSLAVAAFQTGGSRAFGLDFYAGDGVEVGAHTLHTAAAGDGEPQTDLESWLEEVVRGEASEDLRVTYKTGEEAPLSVERVATAPPSALVEASALDELEALGAEELEVMEGVDLRAVVAAEAAKEAPAPTTPTTPPPPQPSSPRNLPEIARMVAEHGFRMERVPGDDGAVKIFPPRGDGWGTLDFDEAGQLVCCAWELSERREDRARTMDLAGGVPDAELRRWLRWGRVRARDLSACPSRRVDELLRAARLRPGALGTGYIHPAEPDAPAVARIEWGAGIVLGLSWLEPWGESHNRTYSDGATEADVVAWLAPWIERAEAERSAEAARSTSESLSKGFEFAGVVRSMDYRLIHNVARSARCADGFEHHDAVDANGEIITRLCRGSGGWWLLEGQKRTPITPAELKALLVRRLMEQAAREEDPAPIQTQNASVESPNRLVALVRSRAGRYIVDRDTTRQAKLPAAVECWKLTTPGYEGGRIFARWEIWPDRYEVTRGSKGSALRMDSLDDALGHILQAAGIEEPPAHRPREAAPTSATVAPPELPGTDALRRGGGGIVRLIESYGFRVEEHATDPGAMTIHPKRRGSKPVGKIGFDGDGRLIELAWEADWSNQQLIDLGGINERRLEHWLLVGEGAYKGRNR